MISELSIPHWILITGFGVFISAVLYFLIEIVRKANIDDLSQAKGLTIPAVIYSLTGAMSPFKKETAYLHKPTYILGIMYHLGSFYAIFLLFLHFFNITLLPIIIRFSYYFLILTSLCGVTILIKRIFNHRLRHLSTADDYFSNILVTGFQILSVITLHKQEISSILFIFAAVLFLYTPMGKLRHAIYFVVSRFYLGLFYGKRGIWPPKRRRAWELKSH